MGGIGLPIEGGLPIEIGGGGLPILGGLIGKGRMPPGGATGSPINLGGCKRPGVILPGGALVSPGPPIDIGIGGLKSPGGFGKKSLPPSFGAGGLIPPGISLFIPPPRPPIDIGGVGRLPLTLLNAFFKKLILINLSL